MADDPPEPNEPGPGPGAGPVSAQFIVLLAFYLVVITGLLIWGIYSRWPGCDAAVCDNQATAAASPSPTPAATPSPSTQASPSPSPTASPSTSPATEPAQPATPTPITIASVSPKSGPMDCKVVITIKGTGFQKGASVIFGGVPATGDVDAKGESINVNPPSHADGEVDVVVKNPDGASSDILKAAYTYTCPPTPDKDLLLLVVFAGALGGALHGLRSLYWYTGLRSLLKSWTLMYFLLPFTGATMAVIFYVIIRAGLLPFQPAPKNVSLGIVAVAILVGLFSQQASIKLKDIFDAFFAKPESGPPAESKPQRSVAPAETKPGTVKAALSPLSGSAGTEVKISGTGMKTVTSATFGGVEGTDRSAVAADGTFTVKVPALLPVPAAPVDVIVKGDKETVKLSFTYKP